MDFSLTAEQNILRETVRRFMETEVKPYQEEDEKHHRFRPEILQKMGELGFFSCCIPEEYGGSGMGFKEAAIITEEIARVSGSYRVHTGMQCLGSALVVSTYGMEQQKRERIPEWISGRSIGFFAITEPNAGSDVLGMSTTAVDRGDHWDLNGQKMFITNAPVGDWGLLYAYTDKSKRSRGMTCFLVNLKEMSGFSVSPIETKMGLHCCPTGEIVMEAAWVPKDSIVGEAGAGFKVCMWQLNNTRLGCAAGAVGLAQAGLEEATKYVNERQQFGQKIGSFQMVRAAIAEMVVATQAARLMVYQAADLKDKGLPSQMQISAAKLFASETAVQVANEAVKLHGGYGYTSEYPIERILRDAKVMQIVEGTSNVQKLIISEIALGEATDRV